MSVKTETDSAIMVEFQRAARNSGELNVSSYQRKENPVNGNDSAPVAWKEKRTTTASGR